MVWGMRLPGSFGDFFPDGEYADRSRTIADHLRATGGPELAHKIDAFQGDISNFKAVVDARYDASQKFTKDLGDLEDFEKPRAFVTVKSYSDLASLVNTENRLIAVGEDLKSIIEGLEPGVHQFWPITITMPKGKIYPKQYYGMRIARFLDSFSPEKSEPGAVGTEEFMGKTKYIVNKPDKKCLSGFALDTHRIGDAQLWREKKRIHGVDFFFSDALHDAIVKAGLRMPTFYKLKAV